MDTYDVDIFTTKYSEYLRNSTYVTFNKCAIFPGAMLQTQTSCMTQNLNSEV